MADTPDRAVLIKEWIKLGEAVRDLQAERGDLAELIAEGLEPGEKIELEPGVGVRLQAPARRFNPDIARELLSNEEFYSICEEVPSVKLARRMLPGELVDMCSPAIGRPSLREL
jgi:hypothetical protein